LVIGKSADFLIFKSEVAAYGSINVLSENTAIYGGHSAANEGAEDLR
jgi:hypothetical protein